MMPRWIVHVETMLKHVWRVLAAAAALSPAAKTQVDFLAQIEPIFRDRCYVW